MGSRQGDRGGQSMRAVGGRWEDEALMPEELGGCSFPHRPDTGRELLRQLETERRVGTKRGRVRKNEGKRQSDVRCGDTK